MKTRQKVAFTLAEPTSRLFNLRRQSKAAFTLAEVLITLGVIGIVAAMTLPMLIQNYKKHVVETRLAKFYSTMTQAIKLSEVKNGDLNNWQELGKMGFNDENELELKNGDLSPMKWYEKYLKDYMNVAKAEEKTNTFNPALATLYFSDGSAVQFDSGGWLFFPYAKDMDYCYSLEQPLECSGTKYFAFYITEKNNMKHFSTYTAYWDGKISTLKGETHTLKSHRVACTKELPEIGRSLCSTWIALNGWKIPKDYPLKF